MNEIFELRGGLFEAGINSGVLMSIIDETVNGKEVYQTYMNIYDLPLFNFGRYALKYLEITNDDLSEEEVVRFMEIAQLQGYDMFRSFIIGLENKKSRNIFVEREHDKSDNTYLPEKQYEVIYAQLGLYQIFDRNNSSWTINKQKRIFNYMMNRLGCSLTRFQLCKYKDNAGEFLNADTLIFLRNKNTGEYVLFASDESGYVGDTMIHINNYHDLFCSLKSASNELYGHSYFRNVSTKSDGYYDGIEINTAIELTSDKETEKANQAMSYAASFLEYLHDNTNIDINSIRVNALGITNKGHACISMLSSNRNEMEKYREIYKNKKGVSLEEKLEKREMILKQEFDKRFTKTGEGEWTTAECIYSSGENGYMITSNVRNLHSQKMHEALRDETSNIIYPVGAPGIGKTTSVQEFVRTLDRALVIYISPRTAINRDFYEKFCEKNGGIAITSDSNCGDNELIGMGEIDKVQKILEPACMTVVSNTEMVRRSRGEFKPTDIRHMEFNHKKIKTSVIERIGKGMGCIFKYNCENDDIKKVAVCLSTQAIGAVSRDKRGSILKNLLGIDKNAGYNAERKLGEAYQNIFVIIDEISGDDTGIASFIDIKRQFQEILKKLKRYSLNVNMKLIVMDASISDSLSVQKYIEGNTKAYIGIHKTEPEERSSSVRLYKYKNDSYINCNCYPASKLHVEINFAIGTKQADMSARIVQDVKSFVERREEIETDCGKRKQQGVVFLQNKQELESIRDMLHRVGIESELLYGDASPDEKAKIMDKMNDENACPIVLMTSSGSRGISFKYAVKEFIAIPNFNIESNLMEIMQVVFRGRGDRKVDSECEKTIAFYYDLSNRSKDNDWETVERRQSIQNIDIYTMSILLDACLRSRIFGFDLTGYKVIPLGRQGRRDRQSDEFSVIKKDIGLLKRNFSSKSAVGKMCDIASFYGVRFEIEDADRHKKFYEVLRKRNADLSRGETGNVLTPFVFTNNCIVFMEKNTTQSIGRDMMYGFKEFSEQDIKDEIGDKNKTIRDAANSVLSFLKPQMNMSSVYTMSSQESGVHYFAYPAIQDLNISMEEYMEEDTDIIDVLSRLIGANAMISDILPLGCVFHNLPFITFRSEEFVDKMMSRYINSELITSTDTNMLSIIFAKNALSETENEKKKNERKPT